MDTQTPEASKNAFRRRLRRGALAAGLSVGAILAAAALASISTNDIPEFVNYCLSYVGLNDEFRRQATSGGLGGALIISVVRFGSDVLGRLQRFVESPQLGLPDLFSPLTTIFAVAFGLFVVVPAASAIAGAGMNKAVVEVRLANLPDAIPVRWEGPSELVARVDWDAADAPKLTTEIDPMSLTALENAATIHIDDRDIERFAVLLKACSGNGMQDLAPIVAAIDSSIRRLSGPLTAIADHVEGLSPHTVAEQRSAR